MLFEWKKNRHSVLSLICSPLRDVAKLGKSKNGNRCSVICCCWSLFGMRWNVYSGGRQFVHKPNDAARLAGAICASVCVRTHEPCTLGSGLPSDWLDSCRLLWMSTDVAGCRHPQSEEPSSYAIAYCWIGKHPVWMCVFVCVRMSVREFVGNSSCLFGILRTDYSEYRNIFRNSLGIRLVLSPFQVKRICPKSSHRT